MTQNRTSTWREKIERCKQTTRDLFRTLWAENPNGVDWNTQADSDDCLRVIARCAKLLAPLRGVVQTWLSEDSERIEHSVPLIEKPDRINKLLHNLARAHTLICGRTQLTHVDMRSVLPVTLDSAPVIRARLFRSLIGAGGSLRTKDVTNLLRCSEPTARREMETLALLGLVERTTADGGKQSGRPETEITLHDDFTWFKSSECHALLELLPGE